MKQNEGLAGRIARSVAGVLMLAFAGMLVQGPIDLGQSVIALAIGSSGAMSLLTGLIGWCPAYALLGINNSRTRET